LRTSVDGFVNLSVNFSCCLCFFFIIDCVVVLSFSILCSVSYPYSFLPFPSSRAPRNHNNTRSTSHVARGQKEGKEKEGTNEARTKTINDLQCTQRQHLFQHFNAFIHSLHSCIHCIVEEGLIDRSTTPNPRREGLLFLPTQLPSVSPPTDNTENKNVKIQKLETFI